MRRLVVVVGLLAWPSALVVLGCSLAVSTSGLAGPPLEPDAALEAGADAGVESGGEGGGLLPDAGGSFCAQHERATFCADFDEDPDPTAGFTDVSTKGSNSTSFTDDSISAPHALLTQVGRTPATNDQASARPFFELPFIARKLHVELDTKVCNLDVGYIEFLKIETTSAGLHASEPGFESSDVALTFDSATEHSALAVEYYTADGSNAGGGTLLPKKFEVGVWFHVSLDVVFAPDTTGSATLFIDRDPTPLMALTNTRTLSSSPTAMRVLIGTFTNQATAPCTNLVDNFLIEASP